MMVGLGIIASSDAGVGSVRVAACKAVYTGSNPVTRSKFLRPVIGSRISVNMTGATNSMPG